jgi:Spy/CpxP family protein refolding chaperone
MRYGKIAFALAMPLIVGSLASAQPPGGIRFGPGALANMLGTNKQLQEELKMDKDQVEKLHAALGKVSAELRDESFKLRDASPEEREKILTRMREAGDKALNSVLKPEQIKRLHQIGNQMAGLSMFNKEDVQKELKLSDEQKERITAIRDSLQKEQGELLQGRPGAIDLDVMKKLQTARKEAMDKAQKVLNDEQKAKAKDLLGEHFELTVQDFGGFGGAGGFGPGVFGFGGGFPQPGLILQPGMQIRLNLTDEQKKQLAELQKDVDSRLDKILSEEQRKQLKELQQGRPAGPGVRPPGGERPGGEK